MTDLLQQLARELAQLKHTAPTGTPVGPMLHGPGGLFGVSGLERDIISSRMQPAGLASVLPVQRSVKTHPQFAYITGFNAPTGSQSADHCSVPPTAGSIKTCIQTAQFGLYRFQTRELDINKVGQAVDAGEVLSFDLVNDPLVNNLAGLFPTLNSDLALEYGREVLLRFVEVGVAFQDLLSRQLFTGTGMTNEFPGLEVLVSETKYDAKTGVECPSLASDVRDFADVNISQAAGGNALVSTLISMHRTRRHMASKMNFGATQFAFVMKEQLFHEVSDVWPCLMSTYKCLPANTNVSINLDTTEQSRLRNDMREGKYLWIDGMRVPVITDDAIVETDLGEGLFSSDIYLLPFSVRGGYQVLYWETFDYSRGTVPAIRDGRSASDFWTDGGNFLWTKLPPVYWCTLWASKIEPRLILRTPHLAARLQNVAYEVEEHYRDVIPGDNYYINGGVTEGYPAPSLYSEWNPPA